MPRGRMLAKKISFDERVARLSIKAALLYTWCIPHCDVEGRMYAEPEIVKGQVVPFIKELNLKTIAECLQEMAKQELILLYGDNHVYMQFIGFNKNQVVNKDREAPSEIPAYDKLKSKSGVNQDQVIAKLNQYNSNINKGNIFVKPSIQEVKDYATSIGFVSLDAEAFWHHYEANGWKQSNGLPIKKWHSAVATWQKNEVKFNPEAKQELEKKSKMEDWEKSREVK